MLRQFGKRGLEDKIPFIIWEIIVILMVVVALTVSVRGIANNTTYWKKYHSADLALMTDLILTNQGDFNINYNLKEMHPNIVTKTLRINPLIFQIFLKDDSFFIYDTSVDKDRFPQSYIFAKNPAINTILGDTTGDYVILRKQGKTFSMGEYYTLSADSCPSEPTSADTSLKHFEVTSLSDASKSYADWINTALKRYAGTEQEMHVFLTQDAAKATTLFYDPNNPVASGKMICLIKKWMLQGNPDMNIITKSYDTSYNSNDIFTNRINDQNNKYNFWIIIQVKTGEISQENLAKAINSAIGEYYD